MNIDLTQAFVLAKSNAGYWSEDYFRQAATIIQEIIKGSIFEWDYGAGEDWGTAMLNGELVALIYTKWPLIVCMDEYKQSISKALAGDFRITIVGVPSMEKDLYSLDPSSINFLFPERWSSSIDPNHFSIGDLWWTTV